MNFRVDNRSGVKQLWLMPSEYKDGVKYAVENNIKSLFLRADETGKYYTIDFSWLKELPEIEILEFIIPLTKNSDIESIYELKKLKKLSYHMNYDKLPLNHTKLKSLEYLYTRYSKNHRNQESGFEALENLKTLRLWHVNNEENCTFLGNLQKIESLEFTWSRSIKTLEGIEKFKLLEHISLRNLSQLENVSVLLELKQLRGIWVESCKKINEEGKKIIEKGILQQEKGGGRNTNYELTEI
jgi:hypothetical protein